MNVEAVIHALEEFAPLSYQESYDNSGLLVGTPDQELQGILISLDCTEEVVDEAIRLGFNMIVSHHPILFKGLKRLNGSTYVERVIMKAIKHGIAIYASHTNLDNVRNGVNRRIAERIGLQQLNILAPKDGLLKKLVVFVPMEQASALRQSLFDAGAGQIGKYGECSFNVRGTGTFKAGDGANPYVGEIGKQHQQEEVRLEVVYPRHLERKILMNLYQTHPYEEVAYDLYELTNSHQEVGSGMIGNLPEAINELDILKLLKDTFNLNVIRHTALLNKPVRRVAVCGGAGGFLLKQAIRAGADLFVTADYRYHEFFDAEGKTVIADIGHFESEQFTQDLLLEIIQKKFSNFAVRLTEVHTNPIKYHI